MQATVWRVTTLSLAVAAAGAAAQSRRDPTPAEAQVLARFTGAIVSTVQPFADGNWQVRGGTLSEDAGQQSIAMHAKVPLDDCVGGDRTWGVRENSPLFNTRILPLYERIKTLADTMTAKYGAGQDASAERQEMARLNQQVKSSNEVTMDVCGNSPGIAAAALAPGQPSLLPSVAAHKVAPEVCGGGVGGCYVLAYGDWKSARLNASRDRYDFHFAHPAGSPYLENIVIQLKGADDRIQEMLKADWARVGAALGGPAGSM